MDTAVSYYRLHIGSFVSDRLLAMKNVVFWDIKPQFVLHRRHITSPLQSPASWCYVRHEFFTALTMKNVIFWDIKPQFVLHRRHITSPLQSTARECYVRFEVFMAVTMKNGVFWDVRRVVLVRTDVSEEPGASFIRVTKIGMSSQRTSVASCSLLFLAHRFLSPWWRRRQVPPKSRFLQEPHGVTSQKTPFVIVCILTIDCICVPYDSYNKQRWQTGLCSGDVMCFLWGTNWILIYCLWCI
jgi:hypothetical protein